MKPQPQPNNWSCLPNALAIVLGLDVKRIIDEIGHDGSEILWPNLPEPYCRRGFHIQELALIGLSYSICLVGFDKTPSLVSSDDKPIEIKIGNFNTLLKTYKGILLGETKSGHRHAVAWDRQNCIDSSGVYPIDRFAVESFWVVI